MQHPLTAEPPSAITPLPVGPSLDLTRRASLDEWNRDPFAEVGPRATLERIARTMPAMTAAQMVGMLLGRAPESTSLTATRGSFQRLHRLPTLWRGFNLTRYRGVWDRSHRALTFRLQPENVRRQARLSNANPFTAVLAWARPDDVFEHRFLMAGLPATLSWADKQRIVRAHITNWARLGLLTGLAETRVPALAWTVTDRGAREYAGERQALQPTHVNHQALAVEAAVMFGAADPALADPAEIVSDAEMQAQARRGIRVGTAFAAERGQVPTPDLEVRLRDGRRVWIEVLSEDYTNKRIVEKRNELTTEARFVTPSGHLARRAAAVLRDVMIHHF